MGIIPSNVREELEEEERQKELAELYLGPRQRKTVLGGENKENENKRERGSQSEESDQEMSDMDDKSGPETPVKKKSKGDKIKGFNDGDIRRFIKSYKKFPLPLTRMSDIALDADLTEKPVANLVDLGRLLRERWRVSNSERFLSTRRH